MRCLESFRQPVCPAGCPIFKRTQWNLRKLQVGQGVADAGSLSQANDDTGKIPGRTEGIGMIMGGLDKKTGGFEQVFLIRLPYGLEARKQSGDKTKPADVKI